MCVQSLTSYIALGMKANSYSHCYFIKLKLAYLANFFYL